MKLLHTVDSMIVDAFHSSDATFAVSIGLPDETGRKGKLYCYYHKSRDPKVGGDFTFSYAAPGAEECVVSRDEAMCLLCNQKGMISKSARRDHKASMKLARKIAAAVDKNKPVGSEPATI